MRVCLLSRYYPPAVGGIEAHVYHLGSALIELGASVSVIAARGPGTGERPASGPPVIDVHTSDRRWVRGIAYMRAGRRTLLAELGKEAFDVVHWHDLYGEWYITRAVRGRAALVFTNHSREFITWHARPAGRPLLRFMLGHADACISPSRELLAKTGDVIRADTPSHYIPNGVDLRQFVPRPEVREEHRKDVLGPFGVPLAEGLRYVVCPRRLETKNGVEYLVRAVPGVLRAAPDTVFLVAGGGFPENLARYRALGAALGVSERLFFLGSVPHERMPALLGACDLAVFPSLIEATSLACLESMACALPVVASDVGGLPEIVTSEADGLLVPPADPAALARAIARLLGDADLAARLAAAARRRVEAAFSWEGIARRTLDVYREAIAARGRPSR